MLARDLIVGTLAGDGDLLFVASARVTSLLHGKLVLGPEWHTSRGSTQGVLPRIPGGSRADEFSFVLSGSREYLCVGRAADAGTGVMDAAREANVSYWSWS